MGLSRCTECETIEGRWRTEQVTDPNAGFGDPAVDGPIEVEVCCECGGVECRQNIPEHDDYDMER